MKSITSLLCLGALSLVSAGVLPPFPQGSLGSDTQNQLLDGTPCRDLTIIFARGTFETGNVGSYVGPQFFQQVSWIIGENRMTIQGVDYPADVQGFYAGGDKGGSQKMADLVVMAQGMCPHTKIMMAGYSQGAQLVHNAAKLLTEEEAEKVNMVVVFGDPDNGQAVGSIPGSKVMTICHEGDDICKGGAEILEAHLNYAEDVFSAAQYLMVAIGLA